MYDRTKYEKKPRNPGLRKNDKQIWNRFIEKYPEAYEEVIYNLHLGQGADIAKDADPSIIKDFVLLTQWKVDVVGFKDDRIDIIEVKPYAGANAIGQLKTYVEMYQGYVDPESKPVPVMITDQLRPDVALLSARLAFRVFIV